MAVDRDSCLCWRLVHAGLRLNSLQNVKYNCCHISMLLNMHQHLSTLLAYVLLDFFIVSGCVLTLWLDIQECLTVILGSCTLPVSAQRSKPVLSLAAQFPCMGAFQTGLQCSVKHAVLATFGQKRVQKRACKEEIIYIWH